MNYQVPMEISGRHLHLSKEDAEVLFGQDYQFKEERKLSQPKQIACEETVKVVSPNNSLEKIRVILPFRQQTQLEISLTDAYRLGINIPVRVSGDLQDSGGGIKIIGPKGIVDLKKGVIAAKRHLHIEPQKAQTLGLKHRQMISIKTKGIRSTTFHDVAVRSRDNEDILAFHLDIDEANAAAVKTGDWGELVY